MVWIISRDIENSPWLCNCFLFFSLTPGTYWWVSAVQFSYFVPQTGCRWHLYLSHRDGRAGREFTMIHELYVLCHSYRHKPTEILTNCGLVMPYEIWVNNGSGNDLLPDGTKPLPVSILTYHQSSSVIFTCEKFYRKCTWIYWKYVLEDYIFKN